ncbi:gag-pol polyprotein [Tanacetum coccineum]
MTRSSTNKLYTSYTDPEREFRSSKKHFKSLSLNGLRFPDFNLLSYKEYSEEKEEEAMAETMEQYMSKTRTNYGSGIARPKIDNKDQFELKGQFLKEHRENTFSGSDNEDANELIEKVLEIVDLLYVPNITSPQHYLTEMQKVILFYNGLDVPTRQILDSRGAVLTKTVADAKIANQEMAEYSQKWHNVKSRGIRASVSVMPLSTYLNLGLGELAHTRLTVELADRTVKYPKGIAENVLVGIGKFTFPIDFIILDMPEDVKVPLILKRPFLSTASAKIDVYKRKITLRVGEEKIIFKSVKPASSIIKRVYMLSLRERMELDLEARLMGVTLVLNRSLDSFLEDYIELNDLNKPFELRRNQGDDLIPTIKEGEVNEEFITRDENLDTGIDDYPRALMNVPIFVGTFSVMTDFAVFEDMDSYRDNEIGDIIFGKPFLREVGIKTKWFEGIITLYNGDNEVTYQMV